MPLYNVTGIAANSTEPLSMIQTVNTQLMNGWFGVMILFILAGVMFMSFIFTTRDFRQSFIATSFITFLLSIMLAAMNLVGAIVVFITLMLVAASVALAQKRD